MTPRREARPRGLPRMTGREQAGGDRAGCRPNAWRRWQRIAEKSRRVVELWLSEGGAQRRRRCRSGRPRQRFHGADAAAARQPGGAGRDAGPVLAGLPDPVAAHDPAHAGPRGRAGDRAGQGRPALPPRAVVRERRLRLRQAELPALGALPARHGEGCGGARRHRAAQARVPHAPAGRRALASATSPTPTPRWWPRRWRAAAATWSRGWRTCSTISSAARASSRSA